VQIRLNILVYEFFNFIFKQAAEFLRKDNTPKDFLRDFSKVFGIDPEKALFEIQK
jgi:hypothetical protein